MFKFQTFGFLVFSGGYKMGTLLRNQLIVTRNFFCLKNALQTNHVQIEPHGQAFSSLAKRYM